MSLADYFVADMALMTSPADFGEPVVYTPLNGQPVTINAIVLRDPPTDQGRQASPKMIVDVVNDPVLGISSSSINFGGDTLTLAYQPGTPPQPFLIHRPSGDQFISPGRIRLYLH